MALDVAKGIAKVFEIGHFVKHFVVDEMEHFFDLVEMGALDYMVPEYTRHLTLHNAIDINKIATLKERQWHMLGPYLWIV